MTDVVWTPDEATIEHANATRLVRKAGAADYARARAPLAGRPRVVLAALHRRPGARVLAAVGPGARRLARARVDDVVHRRQALHRPQLRASLGRPPARRDRGGRPRRGRLAPHAHLRRALARRHAARRAARRRSASARATASRSSCRCRPRWPSPRTRSRTSARSRSRSSPASPRPRSRSGSRRARRRS